MPNGCGHLSRKIGPDHPLAGKTVYIPTMAEGSAEAFAAVFRWLGVNATPTPDSNERTRELGARHTNGDECYPAKVTVGDFIRVIERPDFDPKRTMFFMPTAEGPCRFGQYAPFLAKTLRQIGYGDVQILSPTSKNSYSDLGEISTPFMRAGWRALVAADVIRKALHRTRPYEAVPGSSDKAYRESITDLCLTIEKSCADNDCQLHCIVASMERARERFRRVAAQFDPDLPLIGVVGEIFCRLNTFSNDDLIRKLETFGAEGWLSDIAEWIQYTNAEQVRKLKLLGRFWSMDMLKARLRWHVQNSDEHAIAKPFKEDFVGYEEPDIYTIFECARPYLPNTGVLGEMVLSVGKAAYLASHGADGIIDISPFTCMNGIVSEAVYPKLSKDYGGIPIRNFYFDGTQSDLDRDLGIYMELARSYRERKPYPRKYPHYFPEIPPENSAVRASAAR
jgi:predicted nucleotide-binding protein (sugar kinase/HSP70/actin superfamily)